MNSRFSILWTLLLAIGCAGKHNAVEPSDAGSHDGGTDGGVDGGTDGGVDGGTDGGTCVNTIVQVPYESPAECRSHLCATLDECEDYRMHNPPPSYPHNPPIAGPHYGVWAKWGIHTEPLPVPRGYWVHNLEHGAVVFLYNPDLASQSLINQLIRVHNAIPLMPDTEFPDCCAYIIGTGCTMNHRRTLLTADPLLDTAWAVTVSGPEDQGYCIGYGYYIKSDCIANEQAIVDFAVQHRGRGAEYFCDEGYWPP